MTIIRRQIVAQVRVGSQIVRDWTAIRCQLNLSTMFAKATLVCHKVPGDYNDDVEVLMGAIPGNGLAPRFRGRRREPSSDYYPRGVGVECIGRLGLAAECFNGEDPSNVGGLTIWDLLPSAPATGATAKDIRIAVLQRAGIVVDPNHIGSTGRLYGGAWVGSWINFVWKAGTPTGQEAVRAHYYLQRAGESSLEYLHRYDMIEAEWNGTSDIGAAGGFYRLVESPDGDVWCVKVGGRPRGDIDIDPGSGKPMIFIEGGSTDAGVTDGVNIKTGTFKRGYPRGNRVLVTGADTGIGGQMFFEAPGGNCRSNPIVNAPGGQNPYMTPDQHFYDQNPPSSEMIEWDTHDNYLAGGLGQGMDAETVAWARYLEVNRIEVSGQITTGEDWLCAPSQTHLVQGPAGQPDRFGTGEKVWCQGADVELQVSDTGAPEWQITTTYLGGGQPDEQLGHVPIAA